MKKIIFTIAVIFAGITIADAQTFKKGTNAINVGIGFTNTLYAGSGYSHTIPPISTSYEYGVTDQFGVGGFLGYCITKWESIYYLNNEYYPYGNTYSYFVIGLRGNYHFLSTNKFDIYGGMMLAYNIVSSYDHYCKGPGTYDPYSIVTESGVRISAYAGARYYFLNNIGVFLELGYGWTVFNTGIAIKFQKKQ